jgi:hypothetical protein
MRYCKSSLDADFLLTCRGPSSMPHGESPENNRTQQSRGCDAIIDTGDGLIENGYLQSPGVL